MQVGYAEHGKHRIADELLERAAVPFDRLAHQVEVLRQKHAVRLGVQRFGELGRADEVAQQDRYGAAVGRALALSDARRAERLVVPEDRLLHGTKLLARLEPELLRQHGAGLLKCRKRIGLTSGAVEGAHQLRAKALA